MATDKDDETEEAPATPSKEDEDILEEAREDFEIAKEAESDNREKFSEDLLFSRDDQQWPEKIAQQRSLENRPTLTINKLKAFIRQVVNDSRQNKPSIKARPIDSRGDPATAKVIDGLFRHIEHASDADVAYDTAVEYAVSGNVGYIRVGIDYAHEDAWESDITISRVANPLSIYGDPNSTAADSKDWETAFAVDRLSKAQFKRKYGKKAQVDWDDEAWKTSGSDWHDGESVMVAEYWRCNYEPRKIVVFVDTRTGEPHVYEEKVIAENADLQQLLQAGVMEYRGEREMEVKRFKQHILTGAEVLKTTDWKGRYVPIIPVYGEEFFIDGERCLRSLIYSAKDAQKMTNYWRSTSTELVALAPRVPFIGPVGAFATDSANWSSANTKSHAYLQYDVIPNAPPPQRQPLDSGTAAGALQEALLASDDMKAIIGMYDASLGARSNETSGRAILARQREGDVSTFHFTDNLSRAIRHVGRVVLDLIPHVYDSARIIRILGEDGTPSAVKINAPTPQMGKDGKPVMDPATGNPVMALHDLTIGKYDIAVDSGPSFTTRREEAAMQMTELVRAFPQAAPYIADIMAKNFDWPGADEIAERFKMLVPGQGQGQPQIPPEIMQAIQAGKAMIEKLTAENEALKADNATDKAKAQTQQFDAETKRMKTVFDIGLGMVDAMTPAPEFNGVANSQEKV